MMRRVSDDGIMKRHGDVVMDDDGMDEEEEDGTTAVGRPRLPPHVSLPQHHLGENPSPSSPRLCGM